jgi:hypothetical protein
MSFLKSVGIDVGIIQKGLNYKVSLCNERIDAIVNGDVSIAGGDAFAVSYNPTSIGNWGICGCSSISNVGTGLDILARLRALTIDEIDAVESRVSTLESSGTGGGLSNWSEDSNGHLLPSANDTYDIGNASAKVRHFYLGNTSLKIGDANAGENDLFSANKEWFEGRASQVSLGNIKVSLGNVKAEVESVDTRLQSQETLSAYTIANLPSNAKKGTTVLVEDGNETGDGVALAYWYNGVWYRSSDNAVVADRTIDIYLIAGQSNAHGHATIADLDSSRQAQDGFFYTSWHYDTSDASSDQYYSDWATSLVAGSTRGDAQNNTLGNSNYFGPEIGFASKANSIGLTSRNFGILKHAIGASTLTDVGGTPDRSDWDLTATGDNKGDAYRAFKRAITDATDKLEALGYGYSIKGLLWWQGESNGSLASSYLTDFIADFRNYLDTNYNLSMPKDEFPVVITGTDTIWGQTYEDEVANQDQYIGFVNAEDFGQTSGDGIHVGSSGGNGVADRDSDNINDMFEIGEQYAIQMEKAQAGQTAGWVPVSTDTQLWYDADDDSTVTTDATTGFVTQVDDKSPNSIYLQPSTGAEIEYVLDNSLDRHVLRMSDNSDSLTQHSTNSQFSGTQDWFIVVKALPTSGTQGIWAGTQGKYITFIPSTGYRYSMYWGSEYITSLMHPSGAYNQLTMFCLRHNFSGSHCSSWCNGTQVDSQKSVIDSTYELTGDNLRHSFMQQAGGTPQTNGDLCEVIISKDLTVRTKIEGYLAHKWGIDGLLPTSHAYHSAPP